MEVPALAAAGMKVFLRLYPRSWRKRYGHEMEALLDDVPGAIGVGLDLALGAAAAYAAVIRGNRILSAAGAYLHGVCVAVLLQAIAFISFILVGLQNGAAADISVGPVHLASFSRPYLLGPRELPPLNSRIVVVDLLPTVIILTVLVVALVLVLIAPRLVRTPAK
jgi:hypothetical protein